MEILDALAELRTAALERIAAAARTGDLAAVKALAERVGQIDQDLRALREIDARRVQHARELTGTRLDWDPPVARARPAPEPDLEEPLDADPRVEFLEAAREAGVPLTEVARTLYLTSGGKSVAVPFANEVRPGRWLLSVEDMRYDFVALLCRAADATLHTLVLPRAALDPVWRRLSRSGRHVKLTVARKPDGLWLQVPGQDGLRLDAYLGAMAVLDGVHATVS